VQAVLIFTEPGENGKSKNNSKKEFERTVHELFEKVGIDASALVQGGSKTPVAPSTRFRVTRSLKESGSSYQIPRRTDAESEESDREDFHDERKQRAEMDGTVVYRSNQEIRTGSVVCRVVSARHAAECRILWPTQPDVSARPDHRSRRVPLLTIHRVCHCRSLDMFNFSIIC
jgi:hypothetical protein